ncbi:MAG: hypothetical protein JWP88_446 [Flaviaesturariibacter sp.]|nr:hypothetical protein [Flaviaesturariibacter sp.]
MAQNLIHSCWVMVNHKAVALRNGFMYLKEKGLLLNETKGLQGACCIRYPQEINTCRLSR